MVHATSETDNPPNGQLGSEKDQRGAYNELISQFKTGTVVALKSGGPLMTVSAAVQWMVPPPVSVFGQSLGSWMEPGVHVNWIDETGVPHSAKYQPEMLRAKKDD